MHREALLARLDRALEGCSGVSADHPRRSSNKANILLLFFCQGGTAQAGQDRHNPKRRLALKLITHGRYSAGGPSFQHVCHILVGFVRDHTIGPLWQPLACFDTVCNPFRAHNTNFDPGLGVKHFVRLRATELLRGKNMSRFRRRLPAVDPSNKL